MISRTSKLMIQKCCKVIKWPVHQRNLSYSVWNGCFALSIETLLLDQRSNLSFEIVFCTNVLLITSYVHTFGVTEIFFVTSAWCQHLFQWFIWWCYRNREVPNRGSMPLHKIEKTQAKMQFPAIYCHEWAFEDFFPVEWGPVLGCPGFTLAFEIRVTQFLPNEIFFVPTKK